jgi:FkbM family methyltransferase
VQTPSLTGLDDLLPFQNVVLLAQSVAPAAILPAMVLGMPGLRAFVLQQGTTMPDRELPVGTPFCVLTRFDDEAVLADLGARMLLALDGRRLPELVVAPVPCWLEAHLESLLLVADRLILCDNFRAGQVIAGEPVLSLDHFLQSREHGARALFVATRDPGIATLFKDAIRAERTLTLDTFLEARLQALRQRHGEIQVFDGSWLEAALGWRVLDNDLARVIQFAYRHLRPGSVVFDIGAHAGHSALLFRQRCAKVFAFEPDPEPFRTLATRFCGCAAVVPIQAAVGRSAGTVQLSLDHRGPAAGSSSLLGHLFTESERLQAPKVPVQVLTIDDFCRDQGVVPDFIKIDVEGSEPDVIEGAWAILSQARPPLIFELYGYFAQLRPQDYLGMMDRLATLYDLECQETGEDPRLRFLKPNMPPLTNVACHPKPR